MASSSEHQQPAAASDNGDAYVVVVGACNMDLTSYVTRLPNPGETIHGDSFQQGFGGKGANQCVMCAKMAMAKTYMVGAVGNDTFGQQTLANFKRVGVNTDHVKVVVGVSSGVAPILVDSAGQNSIVIVNGANDELSVDDVQRADSLIAAAKVVVTQMEIKPDTTLEAIRAAHRHGRQCVFNLAPAVAVLDPDFVKLPSIFCANEGEASTVTGLPVTTVEEAKAAAAALRKRGARTVLLTLGSMGTVLLEEGCDEPEHLPAIAVEQVVDTSGAGDAFIGCLAAFLAARPDLSLSDIVLRCNAIAALSVQSKGTQSSYPERQQLEAKLLA